ncbi:uncharacterized protein PHALS_12029 [Plasmopara halstedii]|uniref:Uncharacterized protein n=1 Tax=Plasmopara halstedii TaxID=4781 RepID=A0A0P1ALC2_PLAHL|nr:uncharacterized protein PHALS_12029 [Plasmopara halstedii]CEG41698.1 hypothetical protein PHALS_12029 [Plasmopara halstedii]|eukprot:XP_024578067.1 hypothetical protein PHALS_12029 [Plasmopara halstedii]
MLPALKGCFYGIKQGLIISIDEGNRLEQNLQSYYHARIKFCMTESSSAKKRILPPENLYRRDGIR